MTSAVATESTEFQLNRAHYLARPGSPSFTGAGRKRQGACLHTSRGQLLPRERIAGLIDAGSPFLDFGYLAREGMYDGVPPGATIITGVGQVCGRSCMLIGNDATVKGGTLFGMTAKKHTRAQLLHGSIGCPASHGAVWRWLLAGLANIFPDEGQAGSIMYNQVKMSVSRRSPSIVMRWRSRATLSPILASRHNCAGHRKNPKRHVTLRKKSTGLSAPTSAFPRTIGKSWRVSSTAAVFRDSSIYTAKP